MKNWFLFDMNDNKCQYFTVFSDNMDTIVSLLIKLNYFIYVAFMARLFKLNIAI